MTKIGIITLSVGKSSGQLGFYNTQDIGLAKALAEGFDEVILYVPDPKAASPIAEATKNGITVIHIPCRIIKSHSFPDTKAIDPDLNAMICFADNQLFVPKLYGWCQRNRVVFCPYIGVTESHSSGFIKHKIMGLLYKRNIRVYKKVTCLVKTPNVSRELNEQGIRSVEVMPPGLDKDLLNEHFEEEDRSALREEYGYSPNDKIILFIGRLEEEKRPLVMLDIFAQLLGKDKKYRLIMIGRGSLGAQLHSEMERLGISDSVRLIDRIPNDSMWKMYRIADRMINLNKQEIFGMSILEAMYYKCPVIAWYAPGPCVIIKDHATGRIVGSVEEVIAAVEEEDDYTGAANIEVKDRFMWNNAVSKIKPLIEK